MSRFTDLFQEPAPAAPETPVSEAPSPAIASTPEVKAVGVEKPASKKKLKTTF